MRGVDVELHANPSHNVPGEGLMWSFTPRSARISATVQTVIQTVVTKAIVETGPTLSWWFLSGTQASPIGAQVSTTRSAMSNIVLPEEWRVCLPLASAAEP